MDEAFFYFQNVNKYSHNRIILLAQILKVQSKLLRFPN